MRSYRTLSPLPVPAILRLAIGGILSVALSLSSGPKPSPGGRYPPPLFRGARTFLGIDHREPVDAAARPPGERLPSPSRGRDPRATGTGSRRICPSISPSIFSRPPAALERLDRLLAVGDVVAEALEREVERAVVVERIAQLELLGRGSARRYSASRSHGNSSPGSSLRCGRDVRMADHVGARDVVVLRRCGGAAAPAPRSAPRGTGDSRIRGRDFASSMPIDAPLTFDLPRQKLTPGVPRALVLVDQPDDLAFLGDHVMRADLGRRIAQSRRAPRRPTACRCNAARPSRWVGALVPVGRGLLAMDELIRR